MSEESRKGSCLCGAVSFEVRGPIKPPDACHCTRCRKFSGHYFVSCDLPKAAVAIQGTENISWYRSSDKARRGFCRICGASLFWDPLHRDWIGVALGAFDDPTNTHIAEHIFVADKGDYYEISDGRPQHAGVPGA
jgi:hypothetical protein